MAARRSFGSVFRRRKSGRARTGAKRTGYHPGWYVRYRRGGEEVTRYAGTDRASAQAYLERLRTRFEREEVLGEPRVPDVRFEDYAEEYLAFSSRDHTASTSRTRRDLVRGKLVPFLGGRLLAEIGPRDVESLLAANAALSPASRNRILSALSAMLTRAVRLGYLSQSPTKGIPRAREHTTPLPLVSLADQTRLLLALPAPRRPLFLSALDTGARLGELLRIAWSDIDLDTRSMLLRQTKTGRPRVVRLSKRLIRTLRGLAAQREPDAADTDRVFASAVGGDGNLRWSWRRTFKKAAASIGQSKLRVHDLRHLAAINLVRAGVDLPTVQAHLGHRHLVSTFRYAAYADETASARAANALDRIHGESGDEIEP